MQQKAQLKFPFNVAAEVYGEECLSSISREGLLYALENIGRSGRIITELYDSKLTHEEVASKLRTKVETIKREEIWALKYLRSKSIRYIVTHGFNIENSRYITIEELNLGDGITGTLKQAGIHTVYDLVAGNSYGISNLHYIGPKKTDKIMRKLKMVGYPLV